MRLLTFVLLSAVTSLVAADPTGIRPLGGDGQPQTLIQILNNVLRFGMTPQQAVEAPRWRVYGAGRLGVEPGLSDEVRAELTRRGQRVTVQPPSAEFGGAQMIVIDPRTKVRMVGSDYRREAYGLVW